jgi:uncharacterized protein (DUF2236 family)
MTYKTVNAERLVILSWSRAILMQLAHPLIAAGVAEHSSFRAGPFEAARRLRHTIRAMLSLSFGSPERQARAIEGIRAIHRRVHGRLSHDVGPFRAGTPYSAEDPALLLWVHLTLLESVTMAYQALIRPLDTQALDAYCDETAGVAIALGARPDDVPRTWMALERSLEAAHHSGVLVVGDDARALAHAVLSSRLAAVAWPLGWTNRQLTLGWLPAGIRLQYGHHWSSRDERLFRRAVRLLRGARRLMPERVALWPEARSARADRDDALHRRPAAPFARH